MKHLQAVRRSDVAVALAVAVLYFGCAKLGLSLALQAEQVTAVWPPTGFALAAILRLGSRSIPGIFLGAFLANATAGEPMWVAAGIAIGNTLEALAGATIVRRLNFDARLERIRDVLALLAAVTLSPIVSATLGVTFLAAGGVQPWSSFPGLWWLWWVGDTMGGLVVTPALLLWTAPARPPWRRRRVAEGFLLVLGTAAVSAFIFTTHPAIADIKYAVYPLLIWAALRFGQIGASTTAITMNAIAVAGTAAGRGPYAGMGPEQGLVLLQIFMAMAALTALLLGAVSEEKDRIEHELRETDRRKDEFLAMLGHELRNPLAPIVHAADLLGKGTDEVSNRAIQVIRRQTEHMSRLVDDLLDVARITRGAVHLARRRVPVADAISLAVETWKPLVAERQQQLSVALPSEPLWIDADPARFTQIVANLLHNAAKFTPVGGQISITAEDDAGWLLLCVRDSGPGISRELLPRVFDAFVQGAPPLDRPHGGLGLGLTLVKRLVELHGGTVEAVGGGPGQGSEFRVRVPLAAPPAEAPAQIDVAPATTMSRRVLVVEDNADAREMLVQILKRAGHEVRVSADGPSALAEAQAFSPEVVLLDLGLPGKNGYEVARELRARPQTRDALIVAVTGYGQEEDRARSASAGFDGHLLKPVDRQSLLAVIAAGRR